MKTSDARRVRERWAAEPDRFAREALGVRLWSKQVDVITDLVTHRRVAVASGHNIGKTFLAGVVVLWFLYSHLRARVISAAPTFLAVKTRLWAEVRRLHRRARVPLGGWFAIRAPKLQIDSEGWEAVGVAAGTGDAFQGIHEVNVLVVFDEAQGVAPEIWQAAESMMGSENAHWLTICNPLHSDGDARACFYEKKHLWRTHSISCLEHPNVLAEQRGEKAPYPAAVTFRWCEEVRRTWGELSAYYRARVLGQFSDDPSSTVIPWTYLAACSVLEDIDPPVEDLHIGLDIARFGDDLNVLAIVADRRLVWVETWVGQDLMQTALRLIHIAREWGCLPEHCHLDVVGIGAGVADRCREADFPVDEVNFGEGASGEWSGLTGDVELGNRRAELYWTLRLLLQRRAFIIPEQFGEVWSELVAARYAFDDKDRLIVEPKDEIKKRLEGRSPDHADAVVLACSRGGGRTPFAQFV